MTGGEYSRGRLAIAVACGIIIGAIVTVPSLATHTVCAQGVELGYSGNLSTVVWLVAAPPGGSVAYEAWFQESFDVNGSLGTVGDGFGGLTNGSTAEVTVFNWTMYVETSEQAAGFGSSQHCPSYTLEAGSPVQGRTGGCLSCNMGPPVPAQVGARVIEPSNISIFGHPTSIYNASYPGVPLGNFSWTYSQGQFSHWAESPSLAAASLQFTGEDQTNASNDSLWLFYSIPSAEIGLGIPIHLFRGGSQLVSIPVTQLSPGWTSWYNVTYEFPVTTDQGSWDVFQAAPGSPYSIGGLLFEMTASAMPS
jgi:hypothetical protein